MRYFLNNLLKIFSKATEASGRKNIKFVVYFLKFDDSCHVLSLYVNISFLKE
jgi:hypothetical protein